MCQFYELLWLVCALFSEYIEKCLAIFLHNVGLEVFSTIPGYKFIHVHLFFITRNIPAWAKRVKLNFMNETLSKCKCINVMNASLSIIFNTRSIRRINIMSVYLWSKCSHHFWSIWVLNNIQFMIVYDIIFTSERSSIFINGAARSLGTFVTWEMKYLTQGGEAYFSGARSSSALGTELICGFLIFHSAFTRHPTLGWCILACMYAYHSFKSGAAHKL